VSKCATFANIASWVQTILIVAHAVTHEVVWLAIRQPDVALGVAGVIFGAEVGLDDGSDEGRGVGAAVGAVGLIVGAVVGTGVGTGVGSGPQSQSVLLFS